MDEIEKIESVGGADKASKNKIPMQESLSDEALAAQQEKFQSLTNVEKTESTQFKKIDNRWEVETPEQTNFEAQKKEVTPSNLAEKIDSKKESVGKIEKTAEVQSPSSTAGSFIEGVGDLRGQVKSMATATPADIQAQSKELVGKLEALKEQLASTKGQIKPSYHKVLEHRLTHIDDNVRVALSKVGGEYEVPTETKRAANPVERFINLITHSQSQMQNLDSTIANLQMGGKEVSPVSMIALQVKVGHITQQIELFTGLLNKALEATKSIMSVQV
jgi:hypothetical protein